MCEFAREMTARNEIEVLDIDEKVKDRILRKYDNERAYETEYRHRDMDNLNKIIRQQEVEIKALTGYIAMKEL